MTADRPPVGGHPLRGLRWGLLIGVVAALALFAVVLVVESGRPGSPVQAGGGSPGASAGSVPPRGGGPAGSPLEPTSGAPSASPSGGAGPGGGSGPGGSGPSGGSGPGGSGPSGGAGPGAGVGGAGPTPRPTPTRSSAPATRPPAPTPAPTTAAPTTAAPTGTILTGTALAPGWETNGWSWDSTVAPDPKAPGGTAAFSVTYLKSFGGFALRRAGTTRPPGTAVLRVRVYTDGPDARVGLQVQSADDGGLGPVVQRTVPSKRWVTLTATVSELRPPAGVRRVSVIAQGVRAGTRVWVSEVALR